MSGGPLPVWKKYTTGSKGIWEKIRQLLVLVPNRSSGNPIVSLYRVPPPGGNQRAYQHKEPVTLPTGDITDFNYFKRDHRRNYPQVSSFDQTRVSGLLSLGNKEHPRVLVGEKGYKQLSVYKNGDHVYLSSVLSAVPDSVINGQILGENGEPVIAPSLNKGKSWRLAKEQMYPAEYPCRLFELKA